MYHYIHSSIRLLGDPMNENLRYALGVALAAFVLGVLMGGVYSLPAMRVTKCREPWYTILLGIGLSITILGLGFAFNVSIPLITGAWICALLLLGMRRCAGKLDHNLERFGLVHAFALVGMLWVILLGA